MSDLNLFDLLYAVVGVACLVGTLILATRPTRPISRHTRHRINQALEERGER